MIQPYDQTVEQQMEFVYEQLSEKDRRLYAAVEAHKLPRGGQSYIAKMLGCTRKTIRRGIEELKNPKLLPEKGRIRHKRGGRKRVVGTQPELDGQFLEVLQDYTAGDPMNAEIRWTNLTPPQIVDHLQQEGVEASVYIVKQLLEAHDYVKRKAQKQLSTGECADRDAQFRSISRFKAAYKALGYPSISIDTKKKEYLGNLYRDGHLYTTEVIEVLDHDYSYLAEGVVIPYTIYDLIHNKAYVYLGISKDTAEFVCDCLHHWWTQYGILLYPDAPSILALADSGGSNSYRHYIFKQELHDLVNELGIEIRMAHYPPYCSKWNPVEHRVFPHMTRAMQGVIFANHELVKDLIEMTSTRTGLQVVAHIVSKVYETGKKVADDFKDTMCIVFDESLWTMELPCCSRLPMIWATHCFIDPNVYFTVYEQSTTLDAYWSQFLVRSEMFPISG